MPPARAGPSKFRPLLFQVILVLCSTLLPVHALAQDDSDVPDFWIGLEAGEGLASAICAGCGESGMQAGTTGNVYLGFGVGDQVLLGVQVSDWIDHGGMYSQREDKISRGHFMFVGYYYPWKRVPAFTKLGFGLSSFNAIDRYQPALKGTNGQDLVSSVHSDGPGILVGAGYEIFVSKRVALVPSLSYFYGRHSELTFDTTHLLAEHATLHLIEFNLGIMFHADR